MESIYVFSDDTGLCGELISLARELDISCCAFAISQDQADAALAYGAKHVVFLQGASANPEDYARAMAEQLLKRGAHAFLVGDTARGRNIAAQVAAFASAGMSSGVNTLALSETGFCVTRTIYGGLVEQAEEIDGLQVITVGRGKAKAACVNDSLGDIEQVFVEADERIKLILSQEAENTSIDLSSAKRIVCAGMGFKNKSDLRLAEELAQIMKAELGCTRPIASDREWLDSERYIGLSGKSISPELLVELGVSGQIQHTIGIRDSKIIVSVDSNENAPIFSISDYGIVGDLYEVVPVLARALS